LFEEDGIDDEEVEVQVKEKFVVVFVVVVMRGG